MTKKSNYWAKRFEQLEDASHRYGLDTYKSIEPVFDRALSNINKEIDSWYGRFADNNKITMAEAKKILNGKELKELKWDIDDYIKYGRENAVDEKWTKQLENASARYHVTRLEALKLRTQQAAEVAFGNELDQMDKLARHIYSDSYYHSIFELQKGFNLGWEIGQIDEKKLSKVIVRPWTADGKNFSTRIWNDKNGLISEVHKQLTQTCILGKGPDDAIKAISKKFNTSKSQAGRLIMTEQAYFHSVAQKDAFAQLDVEEFEVVATLDSHTSAICQEMDGKHFPMKDYDPGITAPPFHPWCRSVTAPYFDDDEGERFARDEDGKTYYVPSNMTYPQWKSVFVDKEKTIDEVLKTVEKAAIIGAEEGLLKKPVESSDENYNKIINNFKSNKVEYVPVQKHNKRLSDDEIISLIGGGDYTSGSCASVGFAYVGQKQGWDVRDFRGGKSMETFREWSNLISLTQMEGVTVYKAKGACSLTVGNRLLKYVEEGKEYYLCCGNHASIVRKKDGILQYLELQSTAPGWNNFDKNPKYTLNQRFRCTNTSNPWHQEYDFIIDLDASNFNTDETKSILGFINTKAGKEKKGASGTIK